MMTASKWWRPLLLAASLAALAAACDLQKTANQAQAKTVVIATMLATPPVDIKFDTLAQLDAGLPDSGFPQDAGVLVGDAGITVPPQNLVALFLGQRNGTGVNLSADLAPTPTTGAQVRLTQRGGASWTLAETGSGNYFVDGDAGFTYVTGASYDFVITSGGTTYAASLENAPPSERIAAFHPAPSYTEQAAGAAFVFARPDPPAGQERNLGFISVFAVNSQGQKGDVTWTNIPKTPLDFLRLVVAPTEWKQTTVTIPGTAFPNPGTWYVIMMQSAKLGRPASDNLFLASGIMAGTADFGVVRTR